MPDTPSRLQIALATRYAIDRELGRGGMATVYLAEDLKHHRSVALKVLRPELASALGPERFVREIEIAARLNHPHIVPLFDSGEAGGFLFYVMPYMKGESLRARLNREHRLPLDAALTVTRQVASALGYAHGEGLVHRDVKPENILLHQGEATVTDFGIALAVRAAGGGRLTQAGIALGTPDYMSPEQAFGEATLDARSDLYSLGCVLYEMLTGDPPRLGRTPPSVRARRAEVTTAVEHAIRRTLEREPRDRFASAADFVAALSAPAAGAAPAVAVLPFQNLSADPENAFFADGITEDVIAHLSKVRALTVISRASVMPFKRRDQSAKEIAAALGASVVLDGSVRRAGGRVRIVAQLIDADTERSLWAETYDRDLTDIFAIQTDVAFQIVGALKTNLTPDEQSRIEKEPTTDLEAYRLYVQGRHWLVHYTAPALEKAIGYFQRAIDADPHYALAHATIAVAYAELAENGALSPDAAREQAMTAARTALELDPTLGEAHATMGFLLSLWEYDWEGAETEYRHALELCPSSSDAHDLYGRLLASQGRFDEALVHQRRAQELDPLTHRLDVATTLLRAGRYEEAAEQARRAVEFDPEQDRAHATLAWSYLMSGRVAEGLAELEEAVRLSHDAGQWLAQLGQAYGMFGRPDDARAILARLEQRATEGYVSPYHFAYVYTGLGEHDRAIDMLERAITEHAGAVYGIKGSFLFAPLKTHPRFGKLLEGLGLEGK